MATKAFSGAAETAGQNAILSRLVYALALLAELGGRVAVRRAGLARAASASTRGADPMRDGRTYCDLSGLS
jgi:hypothetical protein